MFKYPLLTNDNTNGAILYQQSIHLVDRGSKIDKLMKIF